MVQVFGHRESSRRHIGVYMTLCQPVLFRPRGITRREMRARLVQGLDPLLRPPTMPAMGYLNGSFLYA